jgi:hypothetical protein
MTKAINSSKTSDDTKKDSSEKIIETLYAELERKDKVIEKLKQENQVLIKTALKAETRLKETERRLIK